MPAFFGLKPEDREIVILEPFFNLMYYGGMSWETYYRFPVAYKKWLIKRIEREIRGTQEQQSEIPSKAPHHNTTDLRSITGKTKPVMSSAKMQRFS